MAYGDLIRFHTPFMHAFVELRLLPAAQLALNLRMAAAKPGGRPEKGKAAARSFVSRRGFSGCYMMTN